MAHKDVLYTVLLKNCIINMEYRTTWVPKKKFYAFIRERANEHFTTR